MPKMKPNEKKARYSDIIKKSQDYSNLALDANFLRWRREVVKRRMDSMKETILTTDPDTDAHKKAAIRYQELKFITDDIFKVFSMTEERARKELKKIEKVD